MRCLAVAALVDLWREDRLTPARRAEVSAHIKECRACAGLLADSAPLRDRTPQAPVGFAAALKARLSRAAEPESPPWRPSLSTELAWALAAAAFLLWAGSLGPPSRRPGLEAGLSAVEGSAP